MLHRPVDVAGPPFRIVYETLTDNPAFARLVLGTDDAERVERELCSFCESCLEAGVEEVFFCRLSVGASFGLRLEGGRRVFLKVHPPDRSPRFLEASRRIQRHLYGEGFPAPAPAFGPVPFGPGFATADELVDDGDYPDGHDPGARREMARALWRLSDLASEVADLRGLNLGWNWPGSGELWPPPHNALLNFEATAGGAEWIDEIAAEAKKDVDSFPGRVLVGHADWNAGQMRFRDGEVSVVYDWDSIRPDKEVIFVGIAASNFTANWHRAEPSPPSPDETWLFVEDYERARGGPLSRGERRAVAAAGIYAIAYVSRCEHAADPDGKGAGGFREALPRHVDAYFRHAM